MGNINIVTAEHEHGYTIIDNRVLSILTGDAYRIYCFLRSRMESWEFSIAGTAKYLDMTIYAVKKAVRQLVEKCFLTFRQLRNGNRYGRYEYTFYELPAELSDGEPVPAKSSRDFFENASISDIDGDSPAKMRAVTQIYVAHANSRRECSVGTIRAILEYFIQAMRKRVNGKHAIRVHESARRPD